jgi:DNA-directed RNA polymerase
LGEIGLDWLKVQLANLFGNNKNSLRDRVNWVDQHMDEVYDSAKHPLDGKRWWTTAEEPFQSLATCIEIVKAIESGDPTTYMSSMPIHQDGSCNGLQHYAALGRDEPGAIAVNLTPSDSPQDVYSKVLEIVQARIDVDVNIPEDALDPRERERGKLARTVQNVVNRKVIKQTVMTSVYGVTKIGARAQVQARLEERMMNDPSTVKSPEADREIFEASRFVFLILPLALHIKFLTVFSLSHIHTHSHNQMQISCGSYIE